MGGNTTPPAAGADGGVGVEEAGGDVLSHRIAPAVPSALRGLTTVFGMGTGVSLAPWPPAMIYGVERGDALGFRAVAPRGGVAHTEGKEPDPW